MALLIAVGPAYHSGLYGSASEIRSTPMMILMELGEDAESSAALVQE